MTMALTNNPLHARPTLRLKSSAPPPEPAPVPKPTPPPRPAPAVAEPLAAAPSKRSLWKIAVATTRRELVVRFPACFKAFNAVKLPLKIGVDKDAIAACPDLDVKLLKTAIAAYCNSGGYPECVTAGAARFDLNGEPCGVVAAHEVRRQKAVMTEEKKK
jgi:ProP effector